MLTFEVPPTTDQPHNPTKSEIAQELTAKPGQWAIVAYCDRAQRAADTASRIQSGTEYGAGFTAVVRRVGNQHRVYAQFIA